MKLDSIDIAILDSLQAHGRVPVARLARSVGLSAGPASARMRKLERAGLIRGYGREVLVEEFVKLVQVFVLVCLEKHRERDLRRFEQSILQMPNVVACSAVGGMVDYVIHFIAQSMGTYQEAIESVLEADLGVRQYWSYVVTKPLMRFKGIPPSLVLKPGMSVRRRSR
jgi:Lrp/AsnC family transcriptional regulator, regulator of ectoine-degradation genes